MNKHKVFRRDRKGMATVTYRQLVGNEFEMGIVGAINNLINVKGLPMPFLRQLMKIGACVKQNNEEFQELRKRLIDEHAQKDAGGQVITIKDRDGNPTDSPAWADKAALDVAWKDMMALTFDCPTIQVADLETHAEKLGLTLALLMALDPIVKEDEAATPQG
jgi:hypothetical protein